MILIGNILDRIREELVAGDDPRVPDSVTLANISLVDAFNAQDPNLQNNLVISLVNIEEEKALRYAKTTTVIPGQNPNDSRVITHNPVIFLNLFVLFSSNHSNYRIALNQLSAVINFFQRKLVFTGAEVGEAERLDKIVFELYSTTFEQMNHLWGVLGGKYIPSVLYKVRVLPHEDILLENGAGRILRERSNANTTQ